MDILIVSRCLPSPIDRGDRLILHHLLRELGARRHRSDLVAFYQREEDLDERARSAALCHDFEAIRERPRAAWRYAARLLRPFPGSARRSWNPEMWAAVARRLQSRRYDVVHLFGGIQVYELRDLVAPHPSIIVPYESHGLFLDRAITDAKSAWERLRSRVERQIARQYERVMFDGFDRIVMISAADRDAVWQGTPSAPIVVIPNGVVVEDFVTPGRVRGGAVLVLVGNYAYGPNARAADMLVRDVLPLIKARVPDARVMLVGPDPAGAVSSLAAPDVELTGWVPSTRPWLARATCSVAPITQGAGMKNKILEAMAAGLPVVTTPIGCDGLAVVDGEHAFVRTDAAGLAEAAVRVLQDPALQERLGTAGQQLVRARYAWPAVARQYEALYADAIDARKTTNAPRTEGAR